MNEKNNEKMKDQGVGRESESQSRRVGSLRETLAEVYSQIDVQYFNGLDEGLVKEIALIIAEIYKLPPTWEVQIDGQKLPAEMVADVYRELTCSHVECVIRGFRGASYKITYKKSYLRTALYNEVFQNDARITNDLRAGGVI